jgi:hypothetical protein
MVRDNYTGREGVRGIEALTQHVPPGTQEFSIKKIIEIFVAVKANEIIHPEGPGGGTGV